MTALGDEPIKSGLLIVLLPLLAVSVLAGFMFLPRVYLVRSGLNNGNANGAAVVDGEAIYSAMLRINSNETGIPS
ncbi:hypothetical protein [Pseudogulbenkiania ferrooxidans]|uniref:hypothetical protein n=1 Tax=Pseudogulbenkiania ferrooxidans TaxID=549169 RepID=UPI00126983B9|nr:hypothetical protein [Pseudogulbenkiania ferrooxidans]